MHSGLSIKLALPVSGEFKHPYSLPVQNLFLQQREIYVLHNTVAPAWKFHYIANLIFFYRILNFFPPEYLINYYEESSIM